MLPPLSTATATPHSAPTLTAFVCVCFATHRSSEEYFERLCLPRLLGRERGRSCSHQSHVVLLTCCVSCLVSSHRPLSLVHNCAAPILYNNDARPPPPFPRLDCALAFNRSPGPLFLGRHSFSSLSLSLSVPSSAAPWATFRVSSHARPLLMLAARFSSRASPIFRRRAAPRTFACVKTILSALAAASTLHTRPRAHSPTLRRSPHK